MGLHTQTNRGQVVIVVLKDGTVIEDRFVNRPKNKRWIELERHGRIPRALIRSFADKKGALDRKRLNIGRSPA